MANKAPFFLTGANAKIKLNGKTIAFATDISYRISVRHASPRVLGRFEVEAHQPLTYDVTGSFTIIKYTKGMADIVSSPPDAVSSGNGVGAWGAHEGVGGALAGALGLPTADGQFDGRADDSFIPSRMFQSKMFDIEIFQMAPAARPNLGFLPGLDGLVNNPVGAVSSLFSSQTDLNNTLFGPNGQCQVAKLQDCRLTSSEFVMSKKSVAQQKFTFVCRYAHEDTFLARKSGVGQELS